MRKKETDREREKTDRGGKDRNIQTESVKHRHAVAGLNNTLANVVSRQGCEEDVITEEEQN